MATVPACVLSSTCSALKSASWHKLAKSKKATAKWSEPSAGESVIVNARWRLSDASAVMTKKEQYLAFAGSVAERAKVLETLSALSTYQRLTTSALSNCWSNKVTFSTYNTYKKVFPAGSV